MAKPGLISMRVTNLQARHKALIVVGCIALVLIICMLPLSGISKPVHSQRQDFPNPYGFYGVETGVSHSGKEIISLEYLPYLNFSLQGGVGPVYYMTMYLDLGSGVVPLSVKVTFSITGLLKTSRYTIANGTQHLVSQSSYWTSLPSDFVFLTDMNLDTWSYNSVKPFTGTSTDVHGNWTNFGLFTHHGWSVHGSTQLQLLTNRTLASKYLNGTIKNISSTSFEQTTIHQFKFKVVLQWQDQIAGLFGISGGNTTLYPGQGDSLLDVNGIGLMQSQ